VSTSTVHLIDLADVIRSAGVELVELGPDNGYPEWRYRGGGGGRGYDAVVGSVVHHTASGPSWDTDRDLDYVALTGPVCPEYAIYYNRAGVVFLIASGRTNHAGKGSWPGIPTDLGNRYLIGQALANNGVGEPYPQPQIESLLRVNVALYLRYQYPIGNLIAHYEWAPTRKIDPAGPPYAAPGDPWLRWDMDRFRGDVWLAASKLPAEPAPIPSEDDTMLYIAIPAWPGADPDLPYLVVHSNGTVRPAISHDTTLGAPLIDITDAGQYDRLRQWADVPLPA
jgi:hypothetical protein